MDKNEELKTQEGKEQADRRLLNIEIVLGVITFVSFVAMFCTSLYAICQLKIYVWPIIMMILSVAILVVGVGFCVYIEQKAGYYECAKCHHKYVPTYKQSLWSPHMGRTKYMKCPHCSRKSWSKKVIE